MKFLVSRKNFTKSRFFTKSTVILLSNSNKMVSSNSFTKPGIFTIFTVTKSGLCCTTFILDYRCNLALFDDTLWIQSNQCNVQSWYKSQDNLVVHIHCQRTQYHSIFHCTQSALHCLLGMHQYPKHTVWKSSKMSHFILLEQRHTS